MCWCLVNSSIKSITKQNLQLTYLSFLSSFVHLSIHAFVSFIHSFIHSFVCLLTPFISSFIYLSVHRFIHWLVELCWCCLNAVLLGGSCNPTTWRHDIAIPFLKQHGISFYNPVSYYITVYNNIINKSMFQRISIVIQCYNAIMLHESSTEENHPDQWPL